jgi:demethylmenaquinone methyltransferase/2-methoxy-6-polyprenyl-1,4-benzoquinol methylase
MAFSTFLKPATRAFGLTPRKVKPKVAEPSDNTRVVLDAFTELAPQYEATMDAEVRQMWGISYREFIDKLIAAVPFSEGARVLDVATGTAMIPRQIASRAPANCHITGLDITPAMLSHGRRQVHAANQSASIRLVCASGVEIAFGRSTFDVITCGLGMHHMDASRLVGEMRRVLKPGGRLIMADVGASPFWRSMAGKIGLKALMVYFGMTRSHSRTEAETDALANLRTTAEWRSFLTSAGFKDITIAELPSRRRFYPHALVIEATI